MLKYIFKRILIFLPTLLIISMFLFSLSNLAPGDPVELRLSGGLAAGSGQLADQLAGDKAYVDLQKKMGLHLPTFYFKTVTKAYPDTLHKIPKKNERKNLKQLISQYGNWNEIQSYYKSIKTLEYSLFNINNESYKSDIRTIRENCIALYRIYDDTKINTIINEINDITNTNKWISQDSLQNINNIRQNSLILKSNYDIVKNNQTRFLNKIPKILWFGTKNQYHRWLLGEAPWFKKGEVGQSKGFVRLDFGYSYLDGRPVKSIILDAVRWTVIINLITIILAYLISIPIGVITAVKKGTTFDKITTTILFMLYSLPSFWVATILIIFITTDEYGMNFFPTYGLGDLESFWDLSYHLILPVFCLVYGSFAFISRQMRGSILDVIQQDYIRTAKAKGLKEKVIIWKHAFRNSLIPIITMFANLLPWMISGSVIVEIIFSIPGMGQASYTSVIARNYPVLFTIVMFSAILTIVGILLADIIYALVDPRIKFDKK